MVLVNYIMLGIGIWKLRLQHILVITWLYFTGCLILIFFFCSSFLNFNLFLLVVRFFFFESNWIFSYSQTRQKKKRKRIKMKKTKCGTNCIPNNLNIKHKENKIEKKKTKTKSCFFFKKNILCIDMCISIFIGKILSLPNSDYIAWVFWFLVSVFIICCYILVYTRCFVPMAWVFIYLFISFIFFGF